MQPSESIKQDPTPGTRMLAFRGDTVTLSLTLDAPRRGTAWVRTNIGYAGISRREIIRHVHNNETPLGRDWYDTPMQRVDDRRFNVRLALCETGHFEAKCYFLEEGAVAPVWPAGTNTVINVEPADACCANIIYNAFVRQFGPNKAAPTEVSTTEKAGIEALDKNGYTVIPPSGTFRDVITELDFILGELGCRILMLLPIHPTPTTYGRMGRFGSPYAALSFTDVDPALAVFDPHATPLEQFIELVDAVHSRDAKLFLDIAINHTGWAASLHETHPQWLVRSPEGRIEVPGAWGVRWEDLTKLDYRNKDLWQFMAEVFIKWCQRGVDGFRCDAGYMIPHAAWRYIVARVREQYTDTVFLLEGLGGRISVTRDLLNTANLNWAYSELFQNYDRGQIEQYLPEAIDISKTDGICVHFAETHDNQRMASRSHGYARMRTAMSALFSHQGAFGFANGVEWLATEKINVHDAPSLNWGATTNQVNQIKRISLLLKNHPAFHDNVQLKMVQLDSGNYVVLVRHHEPSGKRLMIVVNLDDRNPTRASWAPTHTGLSGRVFSDLLTESSITVSEAEEQYTYLLEPGQVLCLTQDEADLALVRIPDGSPDAFPARIEHQRLRAKALEVYTWFQGKQEIEDFDPLPAAEKLKKNPIDFCRSLNPDSREPRVVSWSWPRDLKREVMLPPGHFLFIRSDRPFHAGIYIEDRCLGFEESLVAENGVYFGLFLPLTAQKSPQTLMLKLSVFFSGKCEHAQAPLLILPQPDDVDVKRVFRHTELQRENFVFLATNRRGAMLRVPVSWGRLSSRYDALLAANLNPEHPDNRWIMWARCRMWLVYQGFSQEINSNCTEAFRAGDQADGRWHFRIPTGQGEHVILSITLEMIKDLNAVRMSFYRHEAQFYPDSLADSSPVQIILRPDIENRGFHETSKAFLGPENRFAEAIRPENKGFSFNPDNAHRLQMAVDQGDFVCEPEWQYMVHRPMDQERGLDPDSDLFSPGYFSLPLEGNRQITLTAAINQDLNTVPAGTATPGSKAFAADSDTPTTGRPQDVLDKALSDFITPRRKLKTVIAGYPWFLDWGRDSLIFARGLIETGRLNDARAVLQQFGQYEQNGTLPNMIVGKDAANRDTSDAPLWFTVVCSELIRKEGNNCFLDENCGGRSIRKILFSIGTAVISGTPNGVRMDPESGLVFSPSHFTWMDTNHPAGTPREGYPIEIQALWLATLKFLARIDAADKKGYWQDLAQRVQKSIIKFFWHKASGYLADCLHVHNFQPAEMAVADDALRPNQLLAITLGAVNDTETMQKILSACEELLVPGGIRSLADRATEYSFAIEHNGKLLNDPNRPYWGTYRGDEDTSRKPAYHNGTVWTWPFPSYCEAWAMVYGPAGHSTALAWMTSGMRLLENGCIGHIPEILDGDSPHTPRGCDAQAWGASELLRVWHRIKAMA